MNLIKLLVGTVRLVRDVVEVLLLDDYDLAVQKRIAKGRIAILESERAALLAAKARHPSASRSLPPGSAIDSGTEFQDWCAWEAEMAS